MVGRPSPPRTVTPRNCCCQTVNLGTSRSATVVRMSSRVGRVVVTQWGPLSPKTRFAAIRGRCACWE